MKHGNILPSRATTDGRPAQPNLCERRCGIKRRPGVTLPYYGGFFTKDQCVANFSKAAGTNEFFSGNVQKYEMER